MTTNLQAVKPVEPRVLVLPRGLELRFEQLVSSVHGRLGGSREDVERIVVAAVLSRGIDALIRQEGIR